MISNAQEYKIALHSALASRFFYEAKSSAAKANYTEVVSEENAKEVLKACNNSMFDTLSAIEKDLSHDVVANIMFLANVDHNRINRQERKNARYNVYAYEKDVNIARAAVSAEKLNHYTRAIIETAQVFKENDVLMSHDDAQSACSLSCKVSDNKREKLIVKYQKHVSAKTASTQSSSSINALQSFNVLIETTDKANKTCYILNTESDVTQRLLERL